LLLESLSRCDGVFTASTRECRDNAAHIESVMGYVGCLGRVIEIDGGGEREEERKGK
jgi:hypothetical protein